MSYTVYYPTCSEELEDHICNGCGDDVEHGRVRSIAYIRKDYLPALLADPTSAPLWTAGIVDKKIIIIPEVTGTFDGGAPVEGSGYGDNDSSLQGYKFTLNYKDPNYKANAPFYNGIKRTRNWAVAFRTETQIHISDKPATVIPKNPVTEGLNDEVVFDVTATFSQSDLPVPYDAPDGVFVCFDYN